MPAHSNPDLDRRPPLALLGLVALLVVAGIAAGIYFFAMDRGDNGAVAGDGIPDGGAATTDGGAATEPGPATAAPEDCGSVTVWASPEVMTVVQGAADRATDDCFQYDVVERETATALNAIEGGDAPQVWVPSSTAWPQLAAEDGVSLEVGQIVASSPVLLVTSPETVEGLGQLGIGADSSFADVTTAYRELAASGDAPVSLRMGDPRVDEATMALLAGTRDEAGGWADESAESREVLVRLAQTAVQGDPLTAVEADPTTVVPATEQQLAAAAQEGAELSAVTLGGEAPVVQVPFVRVAEPESASAVDALEQQLISSEAEAELTAAGLRPGPDGAAPGVAGVPGELTVAAGAAEPADVTATSETWAAVAPQSRILTVVDISGSMEAEIGDTTRIDLARTAVQTALSVIPDQTAMGLWYFATGLNGALDHAEQVPLRTLSDEAEDGRTQREVLIASTDDLGLETLTGDTGLHDSLWAAYEYMTAEQTEDTISSVLLLTDGINDDSTGGLTEDQVVGLLEEARQASDSPVTVVLIGMGPDVDEEALQRLAQAAGGESFVLRDALELPQVFVDIVARRAP